MSIQTDSHLGLKKLQYPHYVAGGGVKHTKHVTFGDFVNWSTWNNVLQMFLFHDDKRSQHNQTSGATPVYHWVHDFCQT